MEHVTPAPFSFTELTPTAFLDRAEHAFAARPAIVDGEQRFTYAEFGARSRRLAGALHELGIEPGDRVAALATNSHVMLECHHGVPYAGAVLVPLNTRLSVDEIVHIVEHSGAKLLVATRELVEQARAVAERTGVQLVEEGERYESLVADSPRARRAGHRRARPARDQLHVGHDRTSQGRHVPPPGRQPPGAGDGVPHAAGAGVALPVDPADVPLRRLVLPLGGHRRGRAARVPARDRRRGDLAPDPHRGRHPLLRGADGADDDRPRRGGEGRAGARARHRRDGRRPAVADAARAA